MKKGIRHFGILYGIVLCAFTAYVLLDTFVITRVYAGADSAASTNVVMAMDSGTTGNAAAIVDSDSTANTSGNAATIADSATTANLPAASSADYQDDNIQIRLTTFRAYDTDIHVADIVLSSPEYLRTAFARSAYGKNVTAKTSEIASSVGAVLAINGDFYGARESGYVIRGGVLYRATASRGQEDLVIYADGSFGIINESEVSAEELLSQGAVDVFSFGPALLTDGEVTVTSQEEVGHAKNSNQRTAIAIVGEGHYLFVVSDGRTDESEGLSLIELAQVLKSLGAKTAYNLDGGGSSTMVFQGEVVNTPTTSGNRIKERAVSDIVYIG